MNALQKEIKEAIQPELDALNAKLDRLIELQIESQKNNATALMNVKQVAAMFDVNPVTVRNWVKTEKLKCIRADGNGKMMFSRAQLKEYQDG